MRILRSNLGEVAGRIREAAKRAVRRSVVQAKQQVGAIPSAEERFSADQNRVGFNVQLTKAITSGKSTQPWDLKPGILARAKKFTKSGVPYADVPIHEGHHPNRTLVRWRRVSGNSPSGAWWHPGFPKMPEYKPGPFDFPGVPEDQPELYSTAKVKRSFVDKVKQRFKDFFRRERAR